jgi:hypothetical protein
MESQQKINIANYLVHSHADDKYKANESSALDKSLFFCFLCGQKVHAGFIIH